MDTDKPLDEVEHQWTNFQIRMKANGQTSSLRMSMSCLQLIQYYQGKDIDFTETDELLEFSIKNKLVSTRNGITWGRAKMALLFNDLHRADELAYSVCCDFDKLIQASPPTCELVQVSFLNGMIALTIVSQWKRGDFTPLRTRKQYIREGKRMIQLIKKYALWSPTNFIDKQLFLEAELAVVEGKHDVAMQKYVCAIASSKVSRNLFVHGLANERAGKHCLFQMNQPTIAKSYLNAALVAFAEWKASRKVDHLRKEMEHFDLKNLASPLLPS